MSEVSVKYILSRDDKFKYQLLSRMKQDCEYFLGNGSRLTKHLWAQDVDQQIHYMKEIWKSFPEDGKPEWLTMEEIRKFEKKMKETL